jgi:hypothetical protein
LYNDLFSGSNSGADPNSEYDKEECDYSSIEFYGKVTHDISILQELENKDQQRQD